MLTLVTRLLGEVEMCPGVAADHVPGVVGMPEGVDLAVVINAVV